MDLLHNLGNRGDNEERNRKEEEGAGEEQGTVCSAAHAPTSRATRSRTSALASLKSGAKDPEPSPSSSRLDESTSMVMASAKDTSLPGLKNRPGPLSSKSQRVLREMELSQREEKEKERERAKRKERKEKLVEAKRAISLSVMSTDLDVSNDELCPLEAEPVMVAEVPVPVEPGPSRQVAEVPVPAGPGPSSQGSGSGSGKKGRRKGGGDPYSTGEKIGLRETSLRLAEAKLGLPHDEVVEGDIPPRRDTSRSRSDRSEKRAKASEEGSKTLHVDVPVDVEQKSLGDLREGIAGAAYSILTVAKTSGNLKGTSIKDLKVAVADVRENADELGRRLEAKGDIPGLVAANARLRNEVSGLQAEVRDLKAIIEDLRRRGNPDPLSGPLPGPSAAAPVSAAPIPPVGVPQGSGYDGAAGAPMEVETSSCCLRSCSPKLGLAGTGKKRRAAIASSSSESDGEAPPNKKVGGNKTPPRSGRKSRSNSGRGLVEGSIVANNDLFEMIKAMVEGKLDEIRSEFRAEKSAGPRVTRMEVLAPPGSRRTVDAAMLRKKQASAVPQGAKEAPKSSSLAVKKGEAGTSSQAGPSQPGKTKGRKKKSSSQAAQPPAESSGRANLAPAPVQGEWAKVVGRKERRAAKAATPRPTPGPPARAGTGGGKGGTGYGYAWEGGCKTPSPCEHGSDYDVSAGVNGEAGPPL